MTDSPRWCEICEAWGNHHTDRHETRTVEKSDADVLYEAGYFPWGEGHWIHKNDLGWVRTTEDALEQVGARVMRPVGGSTETEGR